MAAAAAAAATAAAAAQAAGAGACAKGFSVTLWAPLFGEEVVVSNFARASFSVVAAVGSAWGQ
eukprot:7602146-Prorocentrum_lima.AAC.1